MPNYKMSLLCCGGTGCRASESVRIVERLREEIAAAGMDNDVQVVVTGCFGFCEQGPIVKVIPDNTFYTNVKPEDAEEIVKEHVVKGRKVTRLLYEDPDTQKHISDSKHMGFYQKQLRIALRNCDSSIPRISTNILPGTATRLWPRCCRALPRRP